jgi:hypothetical protein
MHVLPRSAALAIAGTVAAGGAVLLGVTAATASPDHHQRPTPARWTAPPPKHSAPRTTTPKSTPKPTTKPTSPSGLTSLDQLAGVPCDVNSSKPGVVVIRYFNGPVTLYCQKPGEPDVTAPVTKALPTSVSAPEAQQVATAAPTSPPPAPVTAPLNPLPESGYETSPLT